eukprot:2101257-Rhodomonas_salina.1
MAEVGGASWNGTLTDSAPFWRVRLFVQFKTHARNNSLCAAAAKVLQSYLVCYAHTLVLLLALITGKLVVQAGPREGISYPGNVGRKDTTLSVTVSPGF